MAAPAGSQPVTSPPEPQKAPEHQAGDLAAAEQAMGSYMRKQEGLETQRVANWGGAGYTVALQRAAEGDEQFRQRKYPTAAEAYRDATARLDAVEAQRNTLLAEALNEGAEALNQGNSAEAAERFSLALEIDADNAAAQRGLARAATIDEVLRLFGKGRVHEANRELVQAKADYDRAVALDADFVEARTGATRVADKIVTRRFQRAMSEGLAALVANDFAAAHAAFEAAHALRPGAKAATDGLAQSDAAIRLRQIAVHRDKAATFEQEERWAEAVQEYEAVLHLDANIRFAQDGRARTRERAELTALIGGYLDQPSRLTSRSVYDRAVALLREASLIENKGPKLIRQQSALEALVQMAGTPVPVRLQSDNLTDVAVYKVGRFGKFTSRELELRPGTYTVVGTRDGYRDVRKEITIVPGEAVTPVVVRCDEEI